MGGVFIYGGTHWLPTDKARKRQISGGDSGEVVGVEGPDMNWSEPESASPKVPDFFLFFPFFFFFLTLDLRCGGFCCFSFAAALLPLHVPRHRYSCNAPSSPKQATVPLKNKNKNKNKSHVCVTDYRQYFFEGIIPRGYNWHRIGIVDKLKWSFQSHYCSENQSFAFRGIPMYTKYQLFHRTGRLCSSWSFTAPPFTLFCPTEWRKSCSVSPFGSDIFELLLPFLPSLLSPFFPFLFLLPISSSFRLPSLGQSYWYILLP